MDNEAGRRVAGSQGHRVAQLQTGAGNKIQDTQHATRNTQPATPNSEPGTPNSKPDFLIGLLLFAAGLYAYLSTLAPTVLEGDAALFQYTPYVLGVTYPTGYPVYILLGKLWLSLLPFGEIAWRMNMFSALCAAAALPLIYGATRRLFVSSPPQLLAPARYAAIAAVLIFATLPTFWRWSTETKIYTLNILLFSGVLYSLTRALFLKTGPLTSASRSAMSTGQSLRYALGDWYRRWPLITPTLLLGLQIGVHSTTVLLIPGLLLFIWLNLRPYLFTWKEFFIHCLLLLLPGLFYFYVPLRAEWLIAQYSRPEAIAHGLLADFYHSGLSGWLRYFTATDFTGGVVTNWGQLPRQFVNTYIPLFIEDFTPVGVALGLIGGLAFAITRPRYFFPLLLVYALPIPFVLTYGQGEQSAFLLPSFLIYAIFAGYTLYAIVLGINGRQPSAVSRQSPSFILHPSPFILHLSSLILLFALIPLLLRPQIEHNVTWLSIKWNRDIYNEWADALNHPLEANAGMLAHWGDLTSFWYLQHAEGYRPDLRGVYPPDEAAVINWFAQNNSDLYIAGPLQGWAEGIQNRYQLLPWGRLVRIAPGQVNPQSLLPATATPLDVTFAIALQLYGAEFAPQAVAGQDYPVTLTWQALQELGSETTISLRLTRDDGIITQLDTPLRSGWFPTDTMPAGQYGLSYPLLPVPLGALPGQYRLQLVAYSDYRQPWTLTNGDIVLDLGPVEVIPPPADTLPNPGEYKIPPNHNFNSQIELAGYNTTASRVGQGKGFGLKLLWQATAAPADNYTLRVNLLDANGNLLRAVDHQPVNGQALTASWQSGQYIKDQVDLLVPAGAPPGQQALQIQLSWLRPDGSPLTVKRWGIPAGSSLNVDTLDVTEKEDRVFDLPETQTVINANLDNKVQLIGYNAANLAQTGPPTIVFNKTDCAAGACTLSLELYWQGLSEMDQLYQTFLHIVDTNGQLVTQHDRVPGRRGKQPTTGWLPGEVVQDPLELALPPDIAPGQYTLRLGMYLPPNGPRLFVLDESGQLSGDFVEIGTLEIE